MAASMFVGAAGLTANSPRVTVLGKACSRVKVGATALALRERQMPQEPGNAAQLTVAIASRTSGLPGCMAMSMIATLAAPVGTSRRSKRGSAASALTERKTPRLGSGLPATLKRPPTPEAVPMKTVLGTVGWMMMRLIERKVITSAPPVLRLKGPSMVGVTDSELVMR